MSYEEDFQVRVIGRDSHEKSKELIAKITPIKIPKEFVDEIILDYRDGSQIRYNNINKSISIESREDINEIIHNYSIKPENIQTISIVMNIEKIYDFSSFQSESILQNHFTE